MQTLILERKQSVSTAVVVVVLGLLTALGPLSIDMYLPAFPDIASNLHSEISKVTLSLSVFFAGISAGQLIYGPLLERFGRKRPLYAGLIIYILAAAACAFSTSVCLLITARLFQALGGCVGMVATRAIVRDLFPVEKNAQIFSMMMLVTSVSPLIAPTAGGYIAATFGWRYIFAVVIILALIVLAGIYYLLPESHEPDPQVSLKPGFILKSFGEVLRNRQFLFYTLAGSLCSIGIFGYIASAPSVFLNHFHMEQKQFGWIIGSISMGIVLASQLNNLALKRFKMHNIALTAAAIQVGIGLIFIIACFSGLNNMAVTIGFIAALLACLGFISPNTSSLAMAPMDKDAGDASALMGSMQMMVGAGSSALISALSEKSILTMAVVMTTGGLLVLALLLFLSGRRFLQAKG
ncbi:multidrug effflux MFS transporter [Chitinophaga agrisoli]|uniref:Multidrug effflux MFS transporter n=1 Tax=Chitinophaga agrisoli TaxID=2607653 RepID=A0A5B2VK75_9BACT|nr:multidrug effflux MFS transporter [Chitinophaga agrisoli]KAA2239385.1 multidrug effflux MFS transporter [Chitinophaga agrisoli]